MDELNNPTPEVASAIARLDEIKAEYLANYAKDFYTISYDQAREEYIFIWRDNAIIAASNLTDLLAEAIKVGERLI